MTNICKKSTIKPNRTHNLFNCDCKTQEIIIKYYFANSIQAPVSMIYFYCSNGLVVRPGSTHCG